jgi:hypothetical protein
MSDGESEEREIRLRLELRRRPVAQRDLDVHDAAACRRWLLEDVEALVHGEGRLPPTVHLLREGPARELAGLEGLVEEGQEAVLAALWRGLFARPDIVRGYRVGELKLRDPETGKLRRAACVMELMPAQRTGQSDAWWCAHRFFGQGQDGVGTFWRPRQEREGAGVEALEPPLSSWLDHREADITDTQVEETIVRTAPRSDVRMALLPPPPEPPRHPAEIAVGIGRSMDAEVLSKGLTCYLVFVLDRDNGQLERWELRGELPCLLDDVIRNITRMGEAHAAVLVTPGTVVTPEGTQRAVHSIAELRGHSTRVRRILPLRFEDGRPIAQPEVIQELPTEAGGGWIGVEPEIDLGLTMQGVSDGLGTGPVGEA